MPPVDPPFDITTTETPSLPQPMTISDHTKKKTGRRADAKREDTTPSSRGPPQTERNAVLRVFFCFRPFPPQLAVTRSSSPMYVSHTPSPIIISIFPSFGQLIFAQQFCVVFLLKGFWCERLDTASSLSSNVNLPNARILHQAHRGTTDDGHRVSGLLLLLSHIWVHTSALPKTSTYHPPMPYLRGDGMVLFFHTHSLPLSLSKCKWKKEIPLISLTLERRRQRESRAELLHMTRRHTTWTAAMDDEGAKVQ